jgi:uncharacterized integral membrane protein (TIGR00697 family)
MKNIRKFDLVMALYVFGVMVSETMGAKTFPLVRARSMVLSGLIVVALLVLYSLLATHLPPSKRFAGSEASYDAIFSATAQISIASLIAFATSELLDVAVFSKLRERLGKKALWFRNNLSNFVSQFADSVIFITLAFYSFHESFSSNISFAFGLIIPYWLIRCALSLIETPLVYLGVGWLRNDKS